MKAYGWANEPRRGSREGGREGGRERGREGRREGHTNADNLHHEKGRKRGYESIDTTCV